MGEEKKNWLFERLKFLMNAMNTHQDHSGIKVFMNQRDYPTVLYGAEE